jgi:hypothetical protein
MLSRKLLTASRRPNGAPATIYGVHATRGFALLQSQVSSAEMSIGPVYPDRVIWVVVPTMGAGGTGDSTTTSVTIAGQAATLQRRQSTSAALEGVAHIDPFGVSYWYLVDDGALGTTALIETFHAVTAQVHHGLVTFTTTKGALEEVGFYADIKSKALATPGSIPTSEGGWAFYCGIHQNALSGAGFTNPDFTNVITFDIGTNEWAVLGYVSPTDGTDLPVGPQAGANSSQNNLFSALAMR